MISTSSANKLSSNSLRRLPLLERHQEERIRDDPADMQQRSAKSRSIILSHLPKFPTLEDSSTEAAAVGSNGTSASKKNRVGLIQDPLLTRRKRKYRRTSSSLTLLQATDSKSLLDRSQPNVCKRNATWAFRREEPPSFYQSEDRLFDALVFGNSENAPNRSSYISYQSKSQEKE